MNKQPAFWDASALVPLCVHEITSRRAQSRLHQFLPVAGGQAGLKCTVRWPGYIDLGN